MELTLTTPSLLFPAIVILMLGYINRYTSTATVIRNYKKDYDSGIKHTAITTQLNILKKRIELSKWMLLLSTKSLTLAALSMFALFADFQLIGMTCFVFSLIALMGSTGVSLIETNLSNRSLLIEVEDIIQKETKRH